MSLLSTEAFLNYDKLAELIQQYAAYGPIAGILLTMIEAIFPPLPLVVFVTINVVAYGFWQGYLYSFIGTFTGSLIMFFLIRRFGKSHFASMIHKRKRLENTLHWIKEKGFMPIFILLTFPLTPSIVVCGLAGLADVKKDEYIFALFFGKLLMVLSLSFIGYNIQSIAAHPLRSVIYILMVTTFSFVGKRLVEWYEKRVEARRLSRKK